MSNLAYGVMPRLLAWLKGVAPGIAVKSFEPPGPEQLRALHERGSTSAWCFCRWSILG